MARLPVPGGDDGSWGSVLNDYLSVTHNSDGTIKNGIIAESQLDTNVQSKLNSAGPGVTSVNGQTGVVTLDKTSVGLANVDNTSDATKNSASVTLTNKTISGASNTISNIAQASVTNLVSDLAGKADAAYTINAQTGTSYAFVLTDAGRFVTLTNAAAITLTVPTNASVAFPVGTRLAFVQLGAGQVTVAPAGGVTVNADPGLKIAAQYGGAELVKLATNTWILVGRLSA